MQSFHASDSYPVSKCNRIQDAVHLQRWIYTFSTRRTRNLYSSYSVTTSVSRSLSDFVNPSWSISSVLCDNWTTVTVLQTALYSSPRVSDSSPNSRGNSDICLQKPVSSHALYWWLRRSLEADFIFISAVHTLDSGEMGVCESLNSSVSKSV